MLSAIRATGLTKFYGRQRGIEALEIDVRGGEVFGFLGPNGAGKTTTIRLLLDLVRPTAGSAQILGLDARADSLAIRRRTGYLPSEFSLPPRWTGREFLDYAAAVRGVATSARDSLVARFGAELDRPLGSLSRGNKQKIALISAFQHDPEVTILDEPTGGLDPLVQRAFQDLVRDVARRGGTVFLSSHDLGEVQRACQRVGIVRDGRLVEVADVASLRQRSIRRVSVTFATPPPPNLLASVAGVRDVHIDREHLECVVSGPMDGLVKALARADVVSVDAREPDLDELFLAYYAGGVRP